jgi:hypothetical protein
MGSIVALKICEEFRLLEPKTLNNVRFEGFKEVTLKNAIFLDIKSQFLHHRKHIISPIYILVD